MLSSARGFADEVAVPASPAAARLERAQAREQSRGSRTRQRAATGSGGIGAAERGEAARAADGPPGGNMTRFAGRVAIVTGGASGIGAATAGALAREGARVVVADVDRERGPRVASDVGGTFGWVDVAEDAQVIRLVADTVRAHGRLDVLVASAFTASVGSIESLGLAEWGRTL